MHETVACAVNDLGDTVDPFLGQSPVARVDAVADGGEDSGVVAGPQLGAEDDMFELRAVGDSAVMI